MVDTTTKVQDALKIALEKEKASYKFYKKAAETVNDPGAKKMFSFLAKEEEKHINMLEEEYDKNILQEM
ncbi:MAG: hypothetical protein A2149_07075 [Candidatus Schekmanbacteria bacterium RBG_16_38_11]|uniref:Rubrerythrin diiron-binding domain-containing protein n=2 Tax=Candidatus Schekmaniibacteriota TaxID=1817811 RepID=A0A1F7RD98_9BACT|nr:MAG: hypothetical protein A2042_04520 [Candidatus Schekmanbacteria bacterium GWA2_38_11]OGL43745.1 MAG: hypothetical protein A2149_07075 [Candidatus Schekmanbacteria bacterium RBG_16_38_11]